jgi:hypothetical protein
VIFDENTSKLDLFKYPSIPSYSDPFGMVEDIGSFVPPMSTSTSSLTSVPELTSSRSMPIELVTSNDHYSEINVVSLTSCLPWWVVKMIEAAGTDVGDILTYRQTHSLRKQLTCVVLMTWILDTFNPETYADAEGKPKWE